MADLKDMACSECDSKSNIVYMHGRCHIGSPTWTYIDLEQNVAVVECADCNEEIIRLKLAEIAT